MRSLPGKTSILFLWDRKKDTRYGRILGRGDIKYTRLTALPPSADKEDLMCWIEFSKGSLRLK